LSAAGVIEVITREGRAPVAKHSYKPFIGKVEFHEVLRNVGEAEAGQRRLDDQRT